MLGAELTSPPCSQVVEEKVVCTKGLGLQLSSRSTWLGRDWLTTSSSDFIETDDIEDL